MWNMSKRAAIKRLNDMLLVLFNYYLENMDFDAD